jgi:UMF1 family MFS transporter
MLEKNNSKLINAWASFDWSNSVYNLIVTAAIFPIYYMNTTEAAFGSELVQFFGITIKNSVLFTYAISCSFLIIVLISPFLSGIADYSGMKKRFMQIFTYLGSFACIGLYFFTGENIEYGIICSVLASIGYTGSLVFYNGFLPEVATVILLILNLVLYQKFEVFGFENGGEATRFGFILVGVWWVSFAQIAFYYLKDQGSKEKFSLEILGYGIVELKKVFTAVKSKMVMKRYLSSFFLFSMGVQTVMLLAPLFADKEIGMDGDEMIIIILILQILAIGGAYFFAWLSKKKGNGFSISTTLIIWIVICISGFVVEGKILFYALAACLGFVMGGIQSISRSTYAKLIPNKTRDTASYFSFYDIKEKLATVIGTLAYGYIDQVTDSMRYSMIFMVLFFIGGYIFLQLANLTKNMS